ncbi:ethanolamine ammonia-lyase reactivating factor EutA [Chloroflexota bacterium]
MHDVFDDRDELELEGKEGVFNPDQFTLHSIGIDIGSSTSLLMISHLLLKRKSEKLSSRFEVVKRDIFHCSPILLTPYQDYETIDAGKIISFITHELREKNIDATHIDTGAVICTGEAAKKKNAEAIARLLSAQVGEFVCVTAGHNMEAVLAAHGSGAVSRSQVHGTIMNVDIGGGTCKLSIVQNSKVLDTVAINVGARLIAWDAQGRLVRIEEPAQKVAQSLGLSLELGKIISEEEKRSLAETLSNLLIEVLSQSHLSSLASALLLTKPLNYRGIIGEIIFSGGVSEYIYGKESGDYGDLGSLLGEEIKNGVLSLGLSIREGSEGIRATVIGASQYTIQISSSTIFLSRPGILPLRDFQVVTPWLGEDTLAVKPYPEEIAKAINSAIERFDLLSIDHHRSFALSIHWPMESSYSSLSLLAKGIALSMNLINNDLCVLVFDADIGYAVGKLLKSELGESADVVVVDEIRVRDFDFIDIGQELEGTQAVPVVVKSLVFNTS